MKDLTKGKEGWQILKFALPMLLGSIFQQMYNVVDSIIVGNYLGKEALAAVGASFPIIFVLISLVIGIASGCTIIISQYFGAKKIEKVKRTIDTMFIFLFFASIIITLAGILFSTEIFELIKLPKEIIPQATTYFQIFVSGFLLMFGFNGTSAILRGLGDSKTPLVFLVISTLTNIMLDFLFIVGFGWGIEGAAFATVLSQGITLTLGIIYLNKKHPIIRFSFRNLTFDKVIFRQSIRIGVPSGLQQSFVALGMIALFRIVNDFGTNAVAAYSAAVRVNSFASMPAMTFGAALSTFVGQNIGANKTSRVRKGFTSTLLMTSIYSLVVTAIVYLFGANIIMAFNKTTEVVNIGESYLHIVGPFYIIFAFMFITQGILRGAGDTLIPMFITLISLWLLRIPISYYLSTIMGTDGIWWGVPIAWISGFVFALIYYLTGKWKNKSITKKQKIVDEIASDDTLK